MTIDLRTAIADRAQECEFDSRAFSIWLSALKYANLLFVVVAGLLSLSAGASILINSNVISVQTAGYMALSSAALTLVHNLLGCDPHQAECRRLKGVFDGLRFEYRALDAFTDEATIRKRLAELDIELGGVLKGASASPARWCIKRAQRQLGTPLPNNLLRAFAPKRNAKP
jgi:hypothetical protein